jgi:hypothetical protein
MLFMVIEHFVNGIDPVGERFKRLGRMLPDGVVYQASWIDASGARCFQIMEAPGVDEMKAWVLCWNDLAEFEVVPVVTSQEFWRDR